MTVDDYKITKDDNNTILITDNYGISYRVDINNYNLGDHTYLYENTRQTADDYSTYGGYVYSKGITQGNSIGVTFPNTLVQSAVTQSTLDPTKKKYHTTEQFREIASDSTEQFMKNLPGLIGKVTGNTNTTTTISSTTAPNYTVVTRGWSGGTQPAVELAAANGSSVAVMIDPNKAGEIEKNNFGLEPPPQEIYQALKENGTVIVSIKGKERTANIATYTEMKAIDNGVPVYVVKNNVESNHTKLEDFARKTRVDAFLSGEISYEQYVANCRANGYNPNNISLLKVTGYDTNGVSITKPISFNDYETEVKVTPTNVTMELKEVYGDLSNFASQYQGSGDTLGSNLAFVSDAMNAINSQITEHTDINYISDGEASIVGTLYKASNYYGAVTNVLYGNLSAETEAVYAIANAIFQMDGAAAYIADTTLSDGMKGLFSRGNASVATALNELKTTSANLLDTAKNAVAAGGRFDELSSILGTTIKEGGVGRISTKSLETAINTIIPNLENEISKATGIKASVSEFMTGIGTSNILQGETWEAVKTNMGNYENLLDCNVKAATFISDTIKTAMGMITNYISGAAETLRKAGTTEFASGIALDEIDDSKLPALESELVRLQADIDRLDAIVTTMEAARHMVADGYIDPETGQFVKTGEHQEPSEEEIQGYRDQLTKIQGIKDILDAYAGVLRGFAPVVKGAQDIINDAVTQVKNAYENPTVDTQGNQTFSSDFSLDLSKYGIDSSIDYKKLAEEYHSDTNTAADTTNPDDKNEDGTQQNPETDKAGDNGTDKNPSNPGSPSPGGPASTPSTPSRNTEREPERTTEIQTKPIEVPTMAPTEPRRETEKPQSTESGDEIVIPDKPPVIEIKDEPEVVRLSSGGYNKKPTNSYVDPLVNPDEPIIIENQDEIIQNQIEEPIIDTGHNEYYEPEIQKPPVVEITPEVEQTIAQPKPGTGVKTMGAASGVGVAIGALALGAYSIMKNKDKHDEEEEDYGYDK